VISVPVPGTIKAHRKEPGIANMLYEIDTGERQRSVDAIR